ncbi:hypothetical protein BFP76_02475 [Amylibacter kogurei]|uniref:Uncharacterized protein n=1 Tax=Paramylibacter kogurei TaxID=1889778 RepID=A0A2G5K3X9_9RHOB|nr:UPF0262 family protein [Amylibacter kogurei]PIB24125.1 hypothetical protein BFP76_02475 [Amylibacter kogurei]
MADPSFLIDITLDDAGLPPPTAETEQERRVAIYDLLEDNQFTLTIDDAPKGPYKLVLGIVERRLVFRITTKDDKPASEFHLSLSPMRQVIRDYFDICESYFNAVTSLPPAQIEAIDMGRRGIHNEGASQLQERLDGKIAVDDMTARRLFTLICVLQFKG